MASSFFFLIFLSLSLSSAQNDAVSPSSSPSRLYPFRPSVAVIVGVLTTLFSVIFLLLLYAKHCNTNIHHNTRIPTTSFSLSSSAAAAVSSSARKNSGIDRAVVESLPVFRFGSLLPHRRHPHLHLDCAVCLSRFDDSEVLRLLPKCRHAFHVECVDTWLDAHSTCPLCRFRVDPEDVLLTTPFYNPPPPPPPPTNDAVSEDVEMGCRVSGRHSSAGERRRALFQMVADTASFRRSFDSWSWWKKRSDNTSNTTANNQQPSVAVGCFDRKERKDGLLLTHDQRSRSVRRRLEHRIIVSPPGFANGGGDGGGGVQFSYNDERWSDVQPSDLLYLRSEMIMGDSRRLSSSGSAWAKSVRRQNDEEGKRQEVEEEDERTRLSDLNSSSASNINGIDDDDDDGSGRRVINTRSVSEITGLRRFSSNDNDSRATTNDTNRQRRQRQRGLLRRWVAWVSQLRPQQTPRPDFISP